MIVAADETTTTTAATTTTTGAMRRRTERRSDDAGETGGGEFVEEATERGDSGSRRRRRGDRALSSSSSSSRFLPPPLLLTLTLLLLSSTAIRTARAFVAPTSGAATSGAATNPPPPPSIDPSEPTCSSSALGAFFGGSTGNGSKRNDDDDDGNGKKKKEEEDGFWSGNELLNSIKYVFGKRNEFLDSIRESLGSTPSSDGNRATAGSSEAGDARPLTSMFFQPRGETTPGPFGGIGIGGSDRNADDFFDDDEEDELPAGTSLLFRIPAKQLKPGGLRLFLMFYLMGMQNTPDRNTWRADQRLMSVNVAPKGFELDLDDDDDENASGEEQEEEKTYVLEMLYDKDRSGMLQIELLPADQRRRRRAEIRIYRCGSRPSTSYLMQESVIVDGVLDELQNISGEKKDTATAIPPSDSDPEEEAIADEDRLLITDPPNAIEAARESLAFS